VHGGQIQQATTTAARIKRPALVQLPENHANAIVACDFFTVVTAWFRVVILANVDVVDKLRFALLPSVRMRARLFGSIRDSVGIVSQAGGAPG
jgi:hypothetical protein